VAKREDKKKNTKQQSRTDAVRAAVDQAFQATADQAEGTQRRVAELADELTTVAGRLREALDGARPVTGADLDSLRAELATLTKRVSALEGAKPAARKPAAATTAKPAARKPASAKPAVRKPAAKPATTTAASRVPAARAAVRRTAAKRTS